jgi:hypothetical protein
MLATILFIIFYLPISSTKLKKKNFTRCLHGCETQFLTLREEHRFRVFESRMLSIVGPKMEEVTGRWRKLQNEELHKMHTPPNIISIIKSRRI